MPTYVYEVLTEDGKPTGGTFEVVQSMKDDAWERVPDKDGTDITMHVTFQEGRAEVSIPWGHRCRRVILSPRVRVKAGKVRDTHMPDFLKRPIGRRESLTHWYPESMVNIARREIGGQAAGCIQDDGTVQYKSLADERRFKRAAENWDRRRDQSAVEHAAKATGIDAMEGSAECKPIPDKLAKRLKAKPTRAKAAR